MRSFITIIILIAISYQAVAANGNHAVYAITEGVYIIRAVVGLVLAVFSLFGLNMIGGGLMGMVDEKQPITVGQGLTKIVIGLCLISALAIIALTLQDFGVEGNNYNGVPIGI